MTNIERASVLFCALTAAACARPECREGEIRIGKTCYEREAEEDASSESDEGEMGEREDGSAQPTRDAGRDARQATRDAEPPQDDEDVDARVPTEVETKPDARVRQDARAVVEDARVQEERDAGQQSACVPGKEVCNGEDDDCDNLIDEDPPTWYPDCDLDGVASIENAITACEKPTPNDCTSWTDERPATSDCNDRDARYSPDVAVFESMNASNPEEEKRYIGDMDCDGVVEKPAVGWEYESYESEGPYWLPRPAEFSNTPVCPANATSCSAALAVECYRNIKAPGQPLGCGNSEIEVFGTFDHCFTAPFSVRVVCR